jgi:hypothetical protein
MSQGQGGQPFYGQMQPMQQQQPMMGQQPMQQQHGFPQAQPQQTAFQQPVQAQGGSDFGDFGDFTSAHSTPSATSLQQGISIHSPRLLVGRDGQRMCGRRGFRSAFQLVSLKRTNSLAEKPKLDALMETALDIKSGTDRKPPPAQVCCRCLR